MELKEICKEIRKRKGLTQKELGLLIGSSQTEISFIEGGFIPPMPKRSPNYTIYLMN